MVVVVLSKCPDSLRGDLTRWLFEVDAGVFVGNPSKRVRENLWLRIEQTLKTGRAVLSYSERNEQGLAFKVLNSRLKPVDFDGIELMFHPENSEKDNPARQKLKNRDSEYEKCLMEKLPDDYIVIDIETTGLEPGVDEITEIGAIKVVNRQIVDGFDRLVRINGNIPDQIVKLTDITASMLNDVGSEESEALKELKNFVDGLPVIGHNIKFDLSFLNYHLQKNGFSHISPETFDTVRLAKSRIKNLKNYKLETLLLYLGCEKAQTHHALEDCFQTQFVFEKLKELNPNK